jgi:hypothetical protein
VGTEGMLEIKCLLPWNHIEVLETREIEPERFAQVGWQLACGGKERRWNDLVHWCPDIKGCDSLRFKYQKIGRDELEWQVGDRLLTGESVIDYFTSEVLKLNAEIEYFFVEHEATPTAPFPFQVLEEEDSVLNRQLRDSISALDGYDPTKSFADNCSFLAKQEIMP